MFILTFSFVVNDLPKKELICLDEILFATFLDHHEKKQHTKKQ